MAEPKVINRDTLVPVGVVATAFLALFGAHTWLSAQFQVLRTEINQVDRRLERLEERSNDRWTRSNQREWALRLKNANPPLQVPDVE